MRYILVLIAKACFSMIILSFLGIFYLQKSYQLYSFCEQYLTDAINNSLEAEALFKLKDINLFYGRVVLADIKVKKNNHTVDFYEGVTDFSMTNLIRSLIYKDNIKIRSSFSHGHGIFHGKEIIKNCSLNFSTNFVLKNQIGLDRTYDCSISGSFDLCHNEQTIEHCFLFGSLINGKGHFEIKGSANQISAEIHKESHLLKISSCLRANVIQKILAFDKKLKGKLTVYCLIDMNNWRYKLRGKMNKLLMREVFNENIKFNELRLRANNTQGGHRFLINDFVTNQNIVDLKYRKGAINCLINDTAFMPKLFSLKGPCDLMFNGKIEENILIGNLHANKLAIIFPKIHNVLKQLDAAIQYDFNKKSCFIENIFLGWHKGQIAAQDITVDGNFFERPIIVPFIISDFFFSLDKNFFVYFNGKPTLTCTYGSHEKPKILLSGDLNINKGGIRYDFEPDKDEINQISNATDVKLDLNIKSKNIALTHKLFNLNFGADVTVQGSIQQPAFSGKVVIVDGSFKFPATNLLITNATMHLSDSETILDINAKGKLNKYTVTMRILGPLSNPKIFFESEPLLSTEQIIALLVTGSHSTILSCFIPNLFMRNFESLIFDSQSPESKKYEALEYVKHFLNALKKIKVIAVEKGQSSEHGKYRVELDIASGLRATINNDLNFEQPKQIGLEYDLSDNIILKGTRDRNNNLSGELELKLKI